VSRRYRVVVVGAGGIGSSATYWLSRTLAADVACLEQWQPGHDRGASEDHSRIIRLGYHASRYTALTRASYEAWQALEREAGLRLVHRTGMVNLAPPGTDGVDILRNYEQAMNQHDIGYERLSGRDVMRRWPQFSLEAEVQALFQPDGGILDIRRAVAANLDRARARGATIIPRARVTEIDDTATRVRLTTTMGTFEADRVVLCAGAWTARLLETALGVRWPIRLTHEQVTYFATPQLPEFSPDRFPIWIWHGAGEFYGFPAYGEPATKAAEEVCGEHVDIETWDRNPDRERTGRVRAFLDDILPGYTGPELYTRCCLYDMPPDRDFVIDTVPAHERISVCIGAGHAAKFAALLGRILAELALDGATSFPITPFRADRPALTDDDYTPAYRFGAGRATL
jgi:monomeric sarcosine oxidase